MSDPKKEAAKKEAAEKMKEAIQKAFAYTHEAPPYYAALGECSEPRDLPKPKSRDDEVVPQVDLSYKDYDPSRDPHTNGVARGTDEALRLFSKRNPPSCISDFIPQWNTVTIPDEVRLDPTTHRLTGGNGNKYDDIYEAKFQTLIRLFSGGHSLRSIDETLKVPFRPDKHLYVTRDHTVAASLRGTVKHPPVRTFIDKEGEIMQECTVGDLLKAIDEEYPPQPEPTPAP